MENLNQTITSLREALSFSPDNVPLKRHLAGLLLQAGQTGEGMQYLRDILAQTDDAATRVRLAEAYLDMSEPEAALDVLNETDQPSGEIWLMRARVEYALEEYEEAADSYEQARRIDPSLTDEELAAGLEKKLVKMQARLQVIEGGLEASDWEHVSERPKITFADVGGMEELKEHIRMNIIYPFQNPFLFKQYGKKVGGGILLYGPPGCGKSFIARATAGECQAHFINISIHEVLDQYIGNSERNLHEIFELARRKAPTVIFIDEIDAIGNMRQSAPAWLRTVTNTLLSELDGIQSNNDDVLVLAATNTPWYVDTALKRPGRFDRMVFVTPPDAKAREEILQIYLRNRPAAGIDYAKVAKKMDYYSGADIMAVTEYAAESALKQAMKTGKIEPIGTHDLLDALKKVKPTTLEWMTTAKNYATYSNDSGQYDEILDYLKKR